MCHQRLLTSAQMVACLASSPAPLDTRGAVFMDNIRYPRGSPPFSSDESASAYPLIGSWAHLRAGNTLLNGAFRDTAGDSDRYGLSGSCRHAAARVLKLTRLPAG